MLRALIQTQASYILLNDINKKPVIGCRSIKAVPGGRKIFLTILLDKDEGLVSIARYILDNPVRKGLVANWREYPYKGAIGCQLDYILQAMV